MSLQTGSIHALTMVLAACAQLALAEGDPERAALIRDAVGVDRFDEVFAAGSRLSQDEAVEAARAPSTVSAGAGLLYGEG